jgi:AcrR family transcriptional regulator
MSQPTPPGVREARGALFDAGKRLAERGALDSIDAGLIAREAGFPAGVFHACFRDENDYLLALHRHFLGGILRQVIATLAGQPPGGDRIQRAVQAFLDACVSQHSMRDLILRTEAVPQVRDAARIRRRGFMEMLRLEFKAAGWAHPAESARLFRVMVEEAAQAELEAGRELPVVRHILWQFLRSDAL